MFKDEVFCRGEDMQWSPRVQPISNIAYGLHNLRRLDDRVEQHVRAGAAHSLEMSSASLCERPPTQGHMIMVAGATLAAQQASWPAPEMMFMWL